MNELLHPVPGINLTGILVGIMAVLIIGFGRWACIRGEYYFTKKIWWLFLIMGMLSVIGSFFIPDLVTSAIVCIFGFTMLWGIMEVIEQEERVKKGWFPQNPHRKKR